MTEPNSPPPRRFATRVQPGTFNFENHYYEKVLNAQLHPLVSFFFNLSTPRMVTRYCHLNPSVIPPVLERILNYEPGFFRWAGSDLFNVTTSGGRRHMVIIETNSCPSGQKSMPLLHENQEQGGYQLLIESAFKPLLEKRLPTGDLAVVYDKNPMENTGYAAAMADAFAEPVWLVEFYHDDPDPPVNFQDGVMHVRDNDGQWHPIRAAHRYVTQRPWTRIPVLTRTAMLNPVLCCLAGGRNKLVAAKAYDIYNADLSGTGLQIRTPYTIRDVRKDEIPLWIKSLGKHGVIKVPYSNAGQGVYTITSQAELEAFQNEPMHYEQFIVQSLIGNANWSSRSGSGQLYHVGTVPTRKGEIFVADLRMMVSAGPDGFRPVAIYARRAREPLVDELAEDADSWSMLGTNLSIKEANGGFTSDSTRLMLTDRKNFNQLGLSLDDLIEAFIQTVLSVIAIDKLGKSLLTTRGTFRRKLYRSLNTDEVLLAELMP